MLKVRHHIQSDLQFIKEWSTKVGANLSNEEYEEISYYIVENREKEEKGVIGFQRCKENAECGFLRTLLLKEGISEDQLLQFLAVVVESLRQEKTKEILIYVHQQHIASFFFLLGFTPTEKEEEYAKLIHSESLQSVKNRPGSMLLVKKL